MALLGTELVPLEWFSRNRIRCHHDLTFEHFVLEDSIGFDLIGSNQLMTSYEAGSFTHAPVRQPESLTSSLPQVPSIGPPKSSKVGNQSARQIESGLAWLLTHPDY